MHRSAKRCWSSPEKAAYCNRLAIAISTSKLVRWTRRARGARYQQEEWCFWSKSNTFSYDCSLKEKSKKNLIWCSQPRDLAQWFWRHNIQQFKNENCAKLVLVTTLTTTVSRTRPVASNDQRVFKLHRWNPVQYWFTFLMINLQNCWNGKLYKFVTRLTWQPNSIRKKNHNKSKYLARTKRQQTL